MKKTILFALMAITSLTAFANKTFPLKGTFVSPADKHILYAGRISFTSVSPTLSVLPGTILACRSSPPSRAHRSR